MSDNAAWIELLALSLLQLFAGLVVPTTLSYCLERWQRMTFIWWLQVEAGSGGDTSGAQPAPAGIQRSAGWPYAAVSAPTVAPPRQPDAIVASLDDSCKPVALWADMLLVGAAVPLVGATVWQLLGLWLRT